MVESGRTACYHQTMQEDAEYVRNRSRWSHRANRRQRTSVKRLLIAWPVLIIGILLINHIRGVDGEYARFAPLIIISAITFSGLIWLFSRAVQKIHLAYVRNTFGGDPKD
jgi:hypothetical protein